MAFSFASSDLVVVVPEQRQNHRYAWRIRERTHRSEAPEQGVPVRSLRTAGIGVDDFQSFTLRSGVGIVESEVLLGFHLLRISV